MKQRLMNDGRRRKTNVGSKLDSNVRGKGKKKKSGCFNNIEADVHQYSIDVHVSRRVILDNLGVTPVSVPPYRLGPDQSL